MLGLFAGVYNDMDTQGFISLYHSGPTCAYYSHIAVKFIVRCIMIASPCWHPPHLRKFKKLGVNGKSRFCEDALQSTNCFTKFSLVCLVPIHPCSIHIPDQTSSMFSPQRPSAPARLKRTWLGTLRSSAYRPCFARRSRAPCIVADESSRTWGGKAKGGKGSHGLNFNEFSIWFDAWYCSMFYWVFQVNTPPTKSNMIHFWILIRKRTAEAAFTKVS